MHFSYCSVHPDCTAAGFALHLNLRNETRCIKKEAKSRVVVAVRVTWHARSSVHDGIVGNRFILREGVKFREFFVDETGETCAEVTALTVSPGKIPRAKPGDRFRFYRGGIANDGTYLLRKKSTRGDFARAAKFLIDGILGRSPRVAHVSRCFRYECVVSSYTDKK